MTEHEAASSGQLVAAKASEPQAPELRRGTLNLGNVALLVLGYYAFAVTLYFVIPLGLTGAGVNFPFYLMLSTVALVPTAISFAVLVNKMPSAGSVYTWVSKTLNRGAGVFIGFTLLTAYGLAGGAGEPLLGGQVFNSALDVFGIRTSYVTAVGGGILLILLVAAFTARAIKPSARAVGVFFSAEAVFTFALAVYFVVRAGTHGHLSAAPLRPATPGSSLGMGLIFGLFSLLAVDIAAPLAEETKTPKRIIPIVSVACLIAGGIFVTFLAYGMAVAAPASTWNSLVTAPSQAGPVYLLTAHYLGNVKILVVITSFTSVLALFVAIVVGAGRIMHAMGRDGYLPRWLARVHPVHQTPRNGQMTMLAVGLVLMIALSTWQDRDFTAAYSWLSQVFVWFVLLFYIAVNVVNTVYHWRFARGQFNWLVNGAVPLIGTGVCVWALYQGFFKTDLGLPFKTGSSIVWFSLAWTVIGAAGSVAAVRIRRRRAAALPAASQPETAGTAG